MEYNRLRWGSRRGMLELDLILMPFVENIYPTLSAEEQALYERLLECEDQDMFSWFLRREQPGEPDIRRIVDIIREHTGGKATS